MNDADLVRRGSGAANGGCEVTQCTGATRRNDFISCVTGFSSSGPDFCNVVTRARSMYHQGPDMSWNSMTLFGPARGCEIARRAPQPPDVGTSSGMMRSDFVTAGRSAAP